MLRLCLTIALLLVISMVARAATGTPSMEAVEIVVGLNKGIDEAAARLRKSSQDGAEQAARWKELAAAAGFIRGQAAGLERVDRAGPLLASLLRLQEERMAAGGADNGYDAALKSLDEVLASFRYNASWRDGEIVQGLRADVDGNGRDDTVQLQAVGDASSAEIARLVVVSDRSQTLWEGPATRSRASSLPDPLTFSLKQGQRAPLEVLGDVGPDPGLVLVAEVGRTRAGVPVLRMLRWTSDEFVLAREGVLQEEPYGTGTFVWQTPNREAYGWIGRFLAAQDDGTCVVEIRRLGKPSVESGFAAVKPTRSGYHVTRWIKRPW